LACAGRRFLRDLNISGRWMHIDHAQAPATVLKRPRIPRRGN
jgi:hypothetical protein